jgi:hypothetical protein
MGGAGAGAGGGGGGGDGGWKWGNEGEEGGSGPEQPIWAEFKALMRGMWVILTNAAIFLLFANMLHRSLDWCCQVRRSSTGQGQAAVTGAAAPSTGK